jgi:hypothetical protein
VFISCSHHGRGELSLYINGELDAYSSAPFAVSLDESSTIILGRSRSKYFLVGKIGGFRFWGSCRTTQQVRKIEFLSF